MRFERTDLQQFTSELLVALGASIYTASSVTESLIKADRLGLNTHGLALLPLYASMIEGGAINPLAKPVTEEITDSINRVNGQSAFGQLTGQCAVEVGIGQAQKHGVSVSGICNGSHLGRLGEWAEMACTQGLGFMAFTNTGGGARNVAPFGGHERKLSTNPIAFGIPTFDALPFDIIIDFATSQVSGSVIRDCNRTGRPLNDEWTITESGAAVDSTKMFLEGMGALLPLGGRVTGHKGFGLSVMAELLGGMAGGLVVGQGDPEWFSNGALFVFVDPTRFLSVAELEERVAAIANHLRNDHVRLPGEGSHQQGCLSDDKGIAIPDHVLKSLLELAQELGVEAPDLFTERAMDIPIGTDQHKTW